DGIRDPLVTGVQTCALPICQEGDGFTVVRAMRDANPDCVTVLLTGYPGFETALKAIHTEVDDYVVKPADIALLVSTMERKLSARSEERRVGKGGDAVLGDYQ